MKYSVHIVRETVDAAVQLLTFPTWVPPEPTTEQVMAYAKLQSKKSPCASKTVLSWDKDKSQWHERCFIPCGADTKLNLECLRPADSTVNIVRASADSTRSCQDCQAAFNSQFKIPWAWWADYSRNSNGHFGCEILTDTAGQPKGFVSWVRLLIKQLEHETQYKWEKLNAVVHWSLDNNCTSVIIFDASGRLQGLVVPALQNSVSLATLQDPFWPYEALLHSVVSLQDETVWGLRSFVRTMEKSRDASEAWKPDFPRMHDLARHVIHVSETLEVAVDVAAAMLSQHKNAQNTLGLYNHPIDNLSYSKTLGQLHFYQSMFQSLRSRSASNQQRLQNEIQLAFNTVSQRDAGDSLKLNHLMQADSTAMKTVAMLTLIFLPATFTAAIFSTSFFGINDEGTWVMSEKFWMYWAFAIPITVVTSFFWTRIKSQGRRES